MIKDQIEITMTPSHDEAWENHLAALEAFVRQFGHCNVPTDSCENLKLANWLQRQSALAREGKLPRERRQRLKTLGWKSQPGRRRNRASKHRWDIAKMFAALEAFKERFGHCRVPDEWPENRRLAQWLAHLCFLGRRDALAPALREGLLNLGVEFGLIQEARWEQMFSALREYTVRLGTWRVVPSGEEHTRLAKWLKTQIQAGRNQRLLPERRQRLTELGVSFERGPSLLGNSAIAQRWNQMFACLEAYKERFGHCRLPYLWPEDQRLAHWLTRQIKRARRGSLPTEQRERMLRLGVVFEQRGGRYPQTQKTWKERFDALASFQRENGHCRVPPEYPRHPRLKAWVSTQRLRYHKQQLSPEQIRLLEGLGFQWRVRDSIREQRLIELAAFKDACGHSNVPDAWPENPQLGNWLSNQRYLKRRGRLDIETVRALEAVGIVWDPARSQEQWEKSFAELCEYRRQHGHCTIHQTSVSLRSLAVWVHRQRYYKKQGKLTESQIRRLVEIGFQWSKHQPPACEAA